MSDRPPWIAGDLLPSGLPLGLPPGASMFALSLWLVGAGNMLGPMSVMSAIAGAASSTSPTRSRSVNLLLSVTAFPSFDAHATHLLAEPLIYWSGSQSLLRFSKYRLSGREGRVLCQVAIFWRNPCVEVCQEQYAQRT